MKLRSQAMNVYLLNIFVIQRKGSFCKLIDLYGISVGIRLQKSKIPLKILAKFTKPSDFLNYYRLDCNQDF